MSADFTSSLWLVRTSAKSETEDFYLHGSDGSLTPIGPAQPEFANERYAFFAGASNRLSHVLFQAFAPRLWPGDSSASPSLYEYEGTNNSNPRLVGISNVGIVEKISEANLISTCGTYLGSEDGDTYNAISHDGSTVFFTARACGPQLPVNELFARVDNGRPDAHTVAISEPISNDCGTCNTSFPAEGQFRGASLDGTKVFFMTAQHLLPEATGAGPDLYEYDFNAPEHGRLTLVSRGDPSGGRVQGVVRVSEEGGSDAYFVAQGVLTGEANQYGNHAEEGMNNLYVAVRECIGGEVSCAEPGRRVAFIAQLAGEEDSGDWASSDAHPVQATPDGRFLVFQSAADLTPDQEGRKEAGQVFEYDSQTSTLLRISRGENGYNEDGNSDLYPAKILVSGSRTYPTGRFERLAVSSDGSYIFFTTREGLTPVATPGVNNVYEYHNGRVALISGGSDLSIVEEGPGVTFLGTDASGKDAFFTTTDQLVPQDTDTQQDIYDARIGGGSPPALVRAPCSGDTCQGAVSGRLPLLGPGSSSVAAEATGAVSPAKPAVKPKPKAKAKKRKPRKGKPKKRRAKKSARR